MFLTLIRREILAHFLTSRFFVVMFICLVLVVISSIVLIGDYQRRLADYNASAQTHRDEAIHVEEEARVYSFLMTGGNSALHANRPPNPLSMFNAGMAAGLGNVVTVHYDFIPTLWDLKFHGSDNPFLDLFSSIDLVSVFQVILSLLAVLLAYDAIAAEREGGTLRLMMTASVSRGCILLAKYTGAMACLIVPLLTSLLLVGVLFMTSGTTAFSGGDWLRIVGIVLTSIIYLSGFYLIGLLISTATRRTATALMLSMFVWVVLLIYPALSVFTVRQFGEPEATLKSAFEEIQQFWDGCRKACDDFRVDADLGTGTMFDIDYGGSIISQRDALDANMLLRYWSEAYGMHHVASKIPQLQAYFQFSVPLQIRTAERTWRARQRAFDRTLRRQAQIAKNMVRFSPTTMYYLATEALAGTDLREIQHFIAAAQQYRETVIDYLQEKDAFSSEQWFIWDKKEVRWEDLPEFSYSPLTVASGVKHALADVVLLSLLNVVLFLAAFLIFIRQEV